MKLRFAVLFFLSVMAIANSQQNVPSKPVAVPSVRFSKGQSAPAFTLTDRLGHHQSACSRRQSEEPIFHSQREALLSNCGFR